MASLPVSAMALAAVDSEMARCWALISMWILLHDHQRYGNSFSERPSDSFHWRSNAENDLMWPNYEKNQRRIMFWWLPVHEIHAEDSFGSNVENLDDSSRITIYSPMNGSVHRRNRVPLVFRKVSKSTATTIKIFLDGEEFFSESAVLSDVPVISLLAEEGNHFISLSMFAYDTDSTCVCQLPTLEGCSECAVLIFQTSVFFSVRYDSGMGISGDIFANFSKLYPSMDLTCENRGLREWNHICRSSRPPAAGVGALVRIFNRLQSCRHKNEAFDCPSIPTECVTVLQLEMYSMASGGKYQASHGVNAYVDGVVLLWNSTVSEQILRDLTPGVHAITVSIACSGFEECANSRLSTSFVVEECPFADEPPPDGTQNDAAGGAGEGGSTESAWVTLVTSDSYAVGALVMMHSLREACLGYRPVRDRILLVTPNVSPGVESTAAAAGLRVRRVEALLSPHELITGREELRATYTKLHAWNLSAYRQAVFLDADVLVRTCPTDLFRLLDTTRPTRAAPSAAAQQVQLLASSIPSRTAGGWEMTSCAFGLWPDEELFKELMRRRHTAGSYDGGDLGLLQALLPDILLYPPHLVAWKRTWSKFPDVYRSEAVQAIDFTGRPKPWDGGEGEGEWLEVRDGVDGSNYLPLYLEWWEALWAFVDRQPPARLADWRRALPSMASLAQLSQSTRPLSRPTPADEASSPPQHASTAVTEHRPQAGIPDQVTSNEAVPLAQQGNGPRDQRSENPAADADGTTGASTRAGHGKGGTRQVDGVCVESWGCFMDWFRDMHAERLSAESGAMRVLVYEPYVYEPHPGYALFSKKHPVGLGNRFIQLVSAFLAAAVSRRALLVRWEDPVPLLRFVEPSPVGVEWDWAEAVTARPDLAALPYAVLYTAEEAELLLVGGGGTRDVPLIIHRPETLCPICRAMFPTAGRFPLIDALLQLQTRPPGAPARFFHLMGGVLRRLLVLTEEMQARWDALAAPLAHLTPLPSLSPYPSPGGGSENKSAETAYLIGVQVRRGKWHVTSRGHANDSGLLDDAGEAAAFRCARLVGEQAARAAGLLGRRLAVFYLLVTDDSSARLRAASALPAGRLLFFPVEPAHSGVEAGDGAVTEGMRGAFLDWWGLGECDDAVLSDSSSFGYVAHARAAAHACASAPTGRFPGPTTPDGAAELPVTVWNDEGSLCRRRLWGAGGGPAGFWSPEALLGAEEPRVVSSLYDASLS